MKIKVGGMELKKEDEQSLGHNKILETKEWVAYKEHGWMQGCDGPDTPPSNMIYLKHKDSGIFFTYLVPLFKDYSTTRNTITGETVTCKFNHKCCYNGEAEIKVSPHQDIPGEVVALHMKGSNIPAYNVIWVSMGRMITDDEARLCYPMNIEDYSLMDGLKHLTDKAVGGIIENKASFGVINNSESMHYIMGKAAGVEPPNGPGAITIAYRCKDSFPCPDNRPIPPVSDEFTQYVFATKPNEVMMMYKTREIIEGQIPILQLGAGIGLTTLAISAVATKYAGWW